MDLKADGEIWEKKICSHWQEGIFDSSPSMVHGCLLDSARLGQQCSIKVSFLSSSKNKIPKYSIIKGFQVNTSFWRLPVCCIVSSHMCSCFLHELYFLLVLMPYLFLSRLVSFSMAILFQVHPSTVWAPCCRRIPARLRACATKKCAWPARWQ